MINDPYTDEARCEECLRWWLIEQMEEGLCPECIWEDISDDDD